MTEKNYTPEQMENAARLARAISQVPESKETMYTMMMNTLLLGAEMAENLMNEKNKSA